MTAHGPTAPPWLARGLEHWHRSHGAPTSPYTAARQAATQLGFLFSALRPTLAQNSFPFMGLRMVEIRACSDSGLFFLFFFTFLSTPLFGQVQFCLGHSKRHDLQTTKIPDSIGQGEKKRLFQPKQTFSQFEVYLISVHINLPH